MDPGRIEAGVDEAGRGCLAGPVYAAAVIWSAPEDERELPVDKMRLVRDSKTLSVKQRGVARAFVESEAWAWGIGVASVEEIEAENILKATMLAMRRALDAMIHGNQGNPQTSGGRCRRVPPIPDHFPIPDHLLIDGERFNGYLLQKEGESPDFIPHSCVVDGDKTYVSIAAASILAKTTRDAHMTDVLHARHPEYRWDKNKGYGTKMHLEAIEMHGASDAHRVKFLSGEGAAGKALAAHVG